MDVSSKESTLHRNVSGFGSAWRACICVCSFILWLPTSLSWFSERKSMCKRIHYQREASPFKRFTSVRRQKRTSADSSASAEDLGMCEVVARRSYLAAGTLALHLLLVKRVQLLLLLVRKRFILLLLFLLELVETTHLFLQEGERKYRQIGLQELAERCRISYQLHRLRVVLFLLKFCSFLLRAVLSLECVERTRI